MRSTWYKLKEGFRREGMMSTSVELMEIFENREKNGRIKALTTFCSRLQKARNNIHYLPETGRNA